MFRFRLLTGILACAFALMWSVASAATFTPGNLVVLQIGDPSVSFVTGLTAPVFLKEYTTAGFLIQTIAIPTTGSAPNKAFTASISATQEGFITRSLDGKYLLAGGYEQPVGTTVSGIPATDNRVVARVSAAGVVDTSTGYPIGGAIRSVCALDGSRFWTASSTVGTRTVAYGGTTATVIATTPAATRVVNSYFGDLYTTGAGAISKFSGMPTSSATASTFLTVGSGNINDYVFTDANTLYVADERSPASGGGLLKYTFNGTSWVLAYTISTGLGSVGIRSLCHHSTNGSGQPVFFAITGESSGNVTRLVTVTDTGAAAAFTVLVTSATNSYFRGVDLVPVDPNTAPTLNVIASPRAVVEQTLETFTATANDPDAGQTLTFSLDPGAPSGASITVGGVFTWTPTEAQGPGTYFATVRVTDNGSPNLSSTQVVQFNVSEANTAPTLAPINDRIETELVAMSLTAVGNDTDIPANTLTYSLTVFPAGMTINPTSGAFSWTPTEAQGPGDYPVTVKVSDGSLDATTSFSVHVNEANEAPTIDPISDQTVNELDLLSVTATGNDTDLPANTLTYSLTTSPSGMSIVPGTGVISWTPTEAQGPGDYPVTVKVSDGSADASTSFSVHVNEVNVAPTIDPIGDRIETELVAMSLMAVGTDSDLPAQTLTYSLTVSPSGMTINPSTGQIDWTPTEAQGPGDYPVTVKVSDGTDFATEDFSVRVDEVNVAPTIDPISDQTVNELTLLSLTAAGNDTDLPAQTLTYSLTVSPSGMTINPSTGQIDWTPTEAQGPGDYPVTVKVSDGTDFATEDFSVRVDEVNVAPTIDPIGDQTVDELTLLSLTATGNDTDLPAQTLTYSLTVSPSGMTINPSTGQIDWTPTEAQGPGDYPVTVKVSDGTDFATEDFSVRVDEVNVAPTIDPISDQTVDELTLLSLTAAGNDTDLPAQTLTYSLTVSPSGMTINPSSGQIDWTPTEAQGPGDYPVTVKVSDGTDFATEDFSVRVDEVNVAPTIDPISDQTVDELTLLSLTAVGNDTDLPAQTLTYSLTVSPSGMTINPSSGQIDWTPTEAQGPGDYPVTVKVSDGTDFATEDFNVRVDEVNVAPTIDPISDQTVDELALLSVTAVGNDTDLPANTLTYSLTTSPSGMTIAPSTGIISWTPTEAQGPGDYPVTVKVSDGSLDASTSFSVHVNEVNVAPTIAPIGDRIETELVAMSLTAVGNDTDLPANTLTYSLTTAPAGMTINPSTGAFSWTPSETQGGGNYPVTVKVSDGSLEASTSFSVQVDETNEAPVLDPVGDKNVTVNTELTFTATASDSDDPAQTLTFSLEGEPLGATISNTGDFSWTPDTVGDYTFDVVVTDGIAEDRETITVHVLPVPVATAAVTVELKFVQLPLGVHVQRWVKVTVGGTGGSNPAVTTDLVADFSDADGPGGDPAAASFNVNIPQGYGAALNRISVKDPLHTLRRTVALTWDGGDSYSATLTGPNALISGDANDDNMNDIVDFAFFASKYGLFVGVNTAINQAGPHPDWTLDGNVLTADYTMLSTQFALVGDALPGAFPVTPKPRKVVRTKELVEMGIKQAYRMDRNSDGWVTIDEIQRYLWGG